MKQDVKFFISFLFEYETYLNKRSSISGNERYSSSTKSTNDDRVVFNTRKFFNPLIIVGRKSKWIDKEKINKHYQFVYIVQFIESQLHETG